MPRIYPSQPSVVQGTGVPPAGNLDGYIFKKSNVGPITAIGHQTTTNLLIQGNTITLDGKTSILIEYYCAWVEVSGMVNNQAAFVELWDSVNGGALVDKGTVGVFEWNTGTIGNTNTQIGGGLIHAYASFTPVSGTHKYALYGWKNVNASTVTFVANAFLDGSGNVAPSFYRITVIPFDASLPA